MESIAAQRFLRQLLLERYRRLLQKVGTTFQLSESQKAEAERQILNLEWIDASYKGRLCRPL